jgi:hypothetical protein
MATNPNAAKTEYEAAVKAMNKFCDDQTDLEAYILDDSYPIRVQFIPNSQIRLFSEDNVDENGEVNDLTVTVGLSSAVRSTLKFKMDSKLLKKLIKLAETVGHLYYQAFREQEGARTTAKRPDYEGDGYADGHLVYDTAYCPECRHSFEEGVNDWGSAFCPDCGQKLDWTQEPEPDEFEAALEKLREIAGNKEGE